jgi:beta-glucosidase
MTLEEKFWQLFMVPGDLDNPSQDWSHGSFGLQISAPTPDPAAFAERVNAIQRYFVERTRLGIPIIPFEEALHGLMLPGATAFPQAIGLAATWDTALVGSVARAIALETRSRGIRQVLSPVVNIADDVRWGRVEETYGEDPWLASLMTRAFVGGFEPNGVITTPKHFVANSGAGGRDSYPVDWSRRTLEELYFPPFRAALQAGARSLMSAYNSVNGLPATQNRWLLTEIAKREWRFPGFIISDAAATGSAVVLHHTEPNPAAAARHALEAGLDVIFQSSWEQHRPWLEAFRSAGIPRAIIDSSVARVLRAKFELGLFEHPYVAPDSAAYWNGKAEHRALALTAAEESIVLLRNEGNFLPLAATIGTVALIGTDAREARLGGYSRPGAGAVSLYDGLRARLGNERVRFAPGPGRESPAFVPVPASAFGAGLSADYWSNPRLEGDPTLTRRDAQIDFSWTFNSPGRNIPVDWYSVRWNGTLTVPAEGVQRLAVEGNDGYRLYLDDRLVIDNWKKQSYRTRSAVVQWEPRSEHRVRLEYFETVGNARIRLLWESGNQDWRAQVDTAVSLVRQADAAIVVAGIEEGEFRDRSSLALPGHQEDLILRIAATGKPVVVVLIGGSAVTMRPWVDSVAAVVMAWYPGEAGGTALSHALFGDINPGGRIPITFPLTEGQLPLTYNHKPTGRGDDYLDLTGKPLFPFGFGLSYTTFTYRDLRIEAHGTGAGQTATIRCTIANAGSRSGDEVVQLYLRRPLASVAQPVLQLAGFQRIGLAPGERREVSFILNSEQLMILDRDLRHVMEPGTVRVLVGSSSADLRLRGELLIR